MKGKGSGWKGESRRHSLARKGVKTVLPDGRRFDVSKFVANGNYDYWNQLYDTVMDYVKHYQNDFLVHDKKFFDKGVNEFILGMRETGTDAYDMDYDPEYFEKYTLDEMLSHTWWVTHGNNDRFFYGKDGKVQEITKEQAKELVEDYIYKYDKLRKEPFTQFPSATDSEIFRDARAEINDRRTYGLRDVRVEPKKFYTELWWSNSDAKWLTREVNYKSNTIQLDANQIVLPYRADEVSKIVNELPPLPLYVYSYEHGKNTAMTDQDKKLLKKEWATLQQHKDTDKGDLL